MFRAYQADEADAARFRARQIQAILRLTPLAMVINLLNVLVLVLALWSQPISHIALLVWSAVVTLLALMGFRGWMRARQLPERKTASRRAMRRGVMQASLLGLSWGALPSAFDTELNSTAQYYVGMVTIGMVCAGGFALSSMPVAGTAYAVCLGTAATLALSDLLWELDRNGRFTHVSARLAHVVGATDKRLGKLRGLTLVRRWMPTGEQGAQQHRQLQMHLHANVHSAICTFRSSLAGAAAGGR